MKHFFKTLGKTLFILLCSLAGAAFVLYPTLPTLTTRWIGDGGDNYEFTSYMNLAAKYIAAGKYPFIHTDFWRYPVGFDFARGFDSYLTVVTGALLSFLVHQPLAYNLTIIGLIAANVACAYLFFRRISKSVFQTLIGTIIYGLSFYSIGKAGGHPNLIFIGGLSLFAYSVVRIIQAPRLSQKDFFVVGISIITIALGSLEYIVLLGIFLPILLGIASVTMRSRLLELCNRIWNTKQALILPALLTVLAVSALYFPHIEAVVTHSISFPDRKVSQAPFQPSLVDYVVPNPYLKLWINDTLVSPSSPSIEKLVFIGWIELALVLVFFLRTSYSKNFKLFIGLTILIPWILSLGYGDPNGSSLLPYHFLVNVFPFSVVVETGRYVVLYEVFIAVAATLAITSAKLPGKLLFLILITLLLAERLPSSTYTSTINLNDPYITSVQNQQSGAVLDIPVTTDSRLYDMLSFAYNKPIVNGYFHFLADGPQENSFIFDNLLTRYWCLENDTKLSQEAEQAADETLLSLLRKNNIRTIVVHKDGIFYHPVCQNVRLRLANLLPYSTALTPTVTEQKITASAVEGKPSFTFFFPQSGTVYLDGVYIAPFDPATFGVYINNEPASFQYSWDTASDNGLTLEPLYKISFTVTAGDTLSFYTNNFVTHTEISLWYRYTADIGSKTIPFGPPVEKVFEDRTAAVYTVN